MAQQMVLIEADKTQRLKLFGEDRRKRKKS